MRAAKLTTVASGVSLLFGIALATPPTHKGMGATFKVISQGQTSLIEIRLRPKISFDTVTVEAASGVASLTPPCSFSEVAAGHSYSCRVNVSHKEGEAALTLNVVGERVVDPDKPRVFEVRHFTLLNPSFVAPGAKPSNKAAQGLILTPPPGTSK